MRTRTLFFAAAALAVTASAATLKSSIVTMNTKVCSALVKSDFKAFEKLTRGGVTKDFVYIEGGQKMNYDQMLAQVKQSMTSTGKITSATSTLLKLAINKNTATAVNSHMMKMTVKGQDKKSHVIVMSGNTTDTYVKVGNEWKMSKMVWGPTRMTMDGKSMSGAKTPVAASKTASK